MNRYSNKNVKRPLVDIDNGMSIRESSKKYGIPYELFWPKYH